jgi:hypothetical protein
MAISAKISDFIERAKASGASDESLVGMLTARGWPEKEIHEALAAHYERVIGVEVPRRSGSGTAAKDAFFYLVAFSTLAAWTCGVGSIAFTLIDRWIADTLFSNSYYNEAWETSSVAASLAAILVSFPIFLLVSRTLVHDARLRPEKLSSNVRKWLTYMALVIAAGVFIGDLIAALSYLLRGELTSRFLAKTFVVLTLSGGVFFYYFGGLRKSEELEQPSKRGLNSGMAAASAIVVALALIFGFWYLGAPKKQRTLRADRRRVQDLFTISTEINRNWNNNGHKMPEDLAKVVGSAYKDPETLKPYEYHLNTGTEYELCATFSLKGEGDDGRRAPNKWDHLAGHYCYQLDASKPSESPNIYLPD